MRPRRLLLILCLLLLAAPASALRITIGLPVAYVYVRVGAQGPVLTVNFAVPANQAGNGVPVVGTPNVEVLVIGRSGRRAGSAYIVTVDSAVGLTGPGGSRIPFSDFSWTALEGEFAPGSFNNSAAQQFFQYTGSFMGFQDTLTFRYRNTSVYRSGTYTGRVRFTVAQL
jgi:hypothetical protein